MRVEIKHRWTNACLWGGEISPEEPSIALGSAVRNAVLSGVDLRDADLRDAVLRGAGLRGAGLRGADLSGVDLRDADLRDADLRGAGLRGAGLRGVLQIGPIGSRRDTLTVWMMADGSRRYSTGCQKQITETVFLERISHDHAADAHGDNYRAAIEFAKLIQGKADA